MSRLRIPGGLLKTYQLRELRKHRQELTTGYVQITTRANLQIRLIQPKNAPEVLRRIQSCGPAHARFGRGQHPQSHGESHCRHRSCGTDRRDAALP